MPKGRAAEDGVIDEGYPNLLETDSETPAERTRLNVRDSDATLIVSCGILTGGSALTKGFAEQYSKPHLHIDLDKLSVEGAILETGRWLGFNRIETINIAGPRASEDKDIYEKAKMFLTKLFD